MIIGILPYLVITSLETGAFVAIVANIDMLMVRRNLAGRRKEGTQEAVAILKENNVQGCASHNSDPKKSTLRKAGEFEIESFGETHYKILRTHLVPNSESGKKRDISRSYPKMWTS